MPFVKVIPRSLYGVVILSVLLLAGCRDDLLPSDKDKRVSVEAGSVGSQVGQLAADVEMKTTLDETLQLTDVLAVNDAVVLYFTMWCPLCDSHMSNIRERIKPAFPNVAFLMVDYVSGTISQSRGAQLANGYASETVIADTQHQLLKQFSGTMGTTVVILPDQTIVMNEDYKEAKLIQRLP